MHKIAEILDSSTVSMHDLCVGMCVCADVTNNNKCGSLLDVLIVFVSVNFALSKHSIVTKAQRTQRIPSVVHHNSYFFGNFSVRFSMVFFF